MADREAMVVGATRLSYGELDDRANRLAQVLHRAGVGPGDTVGLVLRNGHEYLEAMLGAFKLGAVPVNVNTRYTADELHYLLDDAGVVLVLHEPELDDRLAEATAGWHAVRGHLARGPAWEAALATADPTPPPIVDRRGDDRYVLYTGGTTGRPKGVIWRHEDLFFAALGGGNPGGVPRHLSRRGGRPRPAGAPEMPPGIALRPRHRPLDGVGHAAQRRHGGGVRRCRSAPRAPVGPGAGRAGDDARDRRRRVRPPARRRPRRRAGPLGPRATARRSLSGGTTLSPAVRQQLLRHLPGAVVVDGYGTSETGGQGSMPVWPGQADGGLPRFQVDGDTAVLDDAGRPTVPGSGVIGRLARRGRIPLGYLGDPAGSAATFPVIDGERWAVPGDMGRVEADGSVTLLGRGTSSINSGGEKVFPAEVEAVLKAHPAVLDAVVIGVPDDRWGEQVSAVVQLRPGRPVLAADLAVHCRAQLADFKVPRRIVLVDHLQRRPTGKPDFPWARAVFETAAGAAGHQAVGEPAPDTA